MKALDLATLLGKAGSAVSPKDSWQQRLGESASDIASAEQDRKFLADMLGGGMPDPSGRYGLDPGVVLQGLQLRHQIEQSRPEQVQMSQVEAPWGIESVPAEDAPELRRKIWAEQTSPAPTDVEVFEWYDKQDDETKKKFQELMKSRRGKSFGEAMAEMRIKMEERAKTEDKLEAKYDLGTTEHVKGIMDDFNSGDVAHQYSNFAERAANAGIKLSNEQFKETKAIAEAERQIEERNKDVTSARYKTGPEGEGFYVTTKDGEEKLFRKYQRRYPIKAK